MLFAHGTFFDSLIFRVCNSSDAQDKRLQPLMFPLRLSLKLQDAIRCSEGSNWMDYCEQVSAQEEEDNFLIEKNTFCNRRYFQEWMKSHQIVFAIQQDPEDLNQLNYEAKELLRLKNISHYYTTILGSRYRCIFKEFWC